MAIKDGDLDDLKPSSSLDRLKARKRLKPWQITPAIETLAQNSQSSSAAEQPTSTVVGSPAFDQAPDLNDANAPTLNAREPLNADIHISQIEHPERLPNNTDKVPTTSSTAEAAIEIIDATEYRQNTDKRSCDHINHNLASTDKIPTKEAKHTPKSTDKIPTIDIKEVLLQEFINKSKVKNTDKVPTTVISESANEYRQNVDKKSTASLKRTARSTDKVPTKEISKSQLSTDKISAKSRQSTDNDFSNAARSDKEPTKPTSSTDKVSTIVPTTEMSFVGTNTDNENSLGPHVIETLLTRLTGGQERVLMYCYHECAARGLNSFPTRYDDLAKGSSVLESSIRTTTKILKGRGLLEIQFFKGPGGKIIITLPQNVFRVITRTQALQKWSTDKVPTTDSPEYRQNTDNSTDKIASSKLVSNLNKNLLTREENEIGEIDVSSLKPFGITPKQIQDIRNQKLPLTHQQVEQLVEQFAAYAEDPDNLRGVKNCAGLFVRMAQQISKGENPLDGVETAEDRKLREMLEERIKRRESQKIQEQALLEFEFDDWFEQLDQTEKNSIAPTSAFVAPNSHAQKMILKEHFVAKIWEEKKVQLGIKRAH